MKTIALIAVRTGSSRLPDKALLPVLGKPMIERMIERVRAAKCVQEIVLATTTLPGDDRLVELAQKLSIGCFRGSADDVLGRISQAAQWASADLIVEMLGDNPLVHSELIDASVAFFHRHDFDYAATVTTEYPHAPATSAKFPVGIRVQVIPTKTLVRCEALATTQYARENSTTFIYEHPEIFRLGYIEASGKWAPLNRPELTFAVNYRENYDLIAKLFEQCYPKNPNFSIEDALLVFDSSPQWHPWMGAQQQAVS